MDEFWIIVLTFFASLVGTMTGFGSSTIMLPVLLFFYSVPEALLFSAIVHVLVDVWEMEFFKKGIHWKLVLFFGVPGMAASFWGASLAIDLPEELISRIIGCILLGYVVFVFTQSSWSLKANNTIAMIGGIFSGFFAGAFGLGGAIRSTFLGFFNLPKEVFLFTAGAVALMIDGVRVIGYLVGGTRVTEFSPLLLITIVPVSFFASYFGEEIVEHFSHKVFRIVIALFISIIAMKFLLFPSVN